MLNKERIGSLLLLTCALVWGASFIVIKSGISSSEIYSYLFYRYFIATILTLIIFNFKIKITKSSFFLGFILGFIYYIAYPLEALGLTNTNSSMAGFIIGLNVIIVPSISYILFKNRVKGMFLISAFLTILGLTLMNFTLDSGVNINIYEIFVLAFAILVALHIVLTGKYAFRHNLQGLLLVQFTTAMVLTLITSLLFEEYTFSISLFDSNYVTAVLYNGILATFYCFTIQTFMQRYVAPHKVALIFMSEPIFALLLGTLFGGDSYTSIQIVGGVFILLGILISSKR